MVISIIVNFDVTISRSYNFSLLLLFFTYFNDNSDMVAMTLTDSCNGSKVTALENDN